METRLLSRLCNTNVGSDTLSSWAEAHSSNMSTAALRFLKSAPAHQNREEKIKLFKVNQKENENLSSLPDNDAKNWFDFKPSQEKW